MVSFGSNIWPKFTTQPCMKGRGAIDCLKQEADEEEEGEDHLEGVMEMDSPCSGHLLVTHHRDRDAKP